MTRRALALLLLLGACAAGALYRYQSQVAPAESAAAKPRPSVAVPAVAPGAAQVAEHARIDDAAGILGPFGPRLARTADAFHADLGIDIRVITTTAADESIEEQANALFEQHQIGRDAPVGGLLILLNPKLASARIEVGYTLEGALTDHHMGQLARDQLAPYTSYAAAGMALMDVLHYLRDHVLLSVALERLSLPENFKTAKAYLDFQRFVSGGAGAKARLSSLPIDAELKQTISGKQRVQYAPSSEPQESIDAFLRASTDLAGDPTLELFTEGSRLMRKHYPYAPFEVLRRLERIELSKPLKLIVQDDYAVATSDRPAQGFVPVLLHREQGVWRVDLVETWKNLFFDADGNYFLRNSNTPYAFGLKQFGSGGSFDMAAVPMRDVSIERWLEALDRHDALLSYWRAEIWLRNAFVFPQALLAFESARRAAPHDPLILEKFGERARYLGFPELAIPALETIGRGIEMSLADAYNETGDREGARRWLDRALAENPHDLYALRWRAHLAKQWGDQTEERRTQEMIADLERDPEQPHGQVMLYFNPASPRFDPDSAVLVDGTKVFDHSKFGVTIHNTSNRPVEIEKVQLTSMGTAAPSGLGDIKNYWRYPRGGRQLGAREHVYFDKQWGFVRDTGHRHVRYVFHTCWHGVGSKIRQCRTQWVDTMPYIPNPS
jgi:tetratricopeptide (TPR) repeat protein